MRNSGDRNRWVDFQAIKQEVSLEAVLDHYELKNLRRSRQRRDQLEGCCPLHRGERKDAFQANLSKNAFHCFACGAKGNVLDFVAAMERCSPTSQSGPGRNTPNFTTSSHLIGS